MDNKPLLHKVTYEFTQDGNTLGTTEKVESLEITHEAPLFLETGHFIVIRTTGWSIDTPGELYDLLRECGRHTDSLAGVKDE
jgi:hypothetical protein